MFCYCLGEEAESVIELFGVAEAVHVYVCCFFYFCFCLVNEGLGLEGVDFFVALAAELLQHVLVVDLPVLNVGPQVFVTAAYYELCVCF